PALLQVPRGEAGTVCLSAPAGQRELRDLPRAARHSGQQPAAAAGNLPLLAMPRGPPGPGPRQQPRPRDGTRQSRNTGEHRLEPEYVSRALYKLHELPLTDPRFRRACTAGSELGNHGPVSALAIPSIKKANQ